MITERSFNPMTERYQFDFGECSADQGFAQVDTGQDASYFGIWANPTSLQIVTFMEGDIVRMTAESPDEFVDEVLGIWVWNEDNGHGFEGIDPCLQPAIEQGFVGLGLGELLH